MQAIINLPDALYHKSEAVAASRGATVEELIIEAVAREVQGVTESSASILNTAGSREVELPVIRSKRPGTLDLSRFDFDELLA
jgi:hypothetical protein